MALSQIWLDQIELYLSSSIISHSPVSGGDISSAYELHTKESRIFVKVQSRSVAREMFEAEKDGLDLLCEKGECLTPDTLGILQVEKEAALLLSFVDKSSPTKEFWHSFAQTITDLHAKTSNNFGHIRSNFIGLLPQSNHLHSSWSEFYARERILPLARRCFDLELFQKKDLTAIDRFCKSILDIYPEERASLLHGDLWSGNFLCRSDQKAVLIDPAVYYGHREMDIAMTLLFGGYDSSFYERYQEIYPMDAGWRQRMKYSQLYYLLVHLCLFGASYYSSVHSILQEFTPSE